MKYEKAPTTIEQQLERLKNRGMSIADPDAARFYLTHIGYYRLRGYWIPFEDAPPAEGEHAFKLGTTFEQVLTSFLHHLTVIRNICAHHGRLWNSELTVTMQLPRSKPRALAANIEHGQDPIQAPRRLYNTLVMLAYLMDVISPDHHWKHRLKCLVAHHGIDTRQMGFPEGFPDRPIWSDTWKEIEQ